MGKSFNDCALKVICTPSSTVEIALFVTHAPRGQIKPHVPLYLKALRTQGISVVVIVVADDLRHVDTSALEPFCDGLLVRENGGYDFAAWAHASSWLDLTETRLLLLVNDSLVGPINEADFCRLFERVRNSKAELVGITDSHDHGYHFQSFFLAAKNVGVSCLLRFLKNVRMLEAKSDVILAYEVRLRHIFHSDGLRCEVLFPSPIGFGQNTTIYRWDHLLYEGFPFIKTVVLQALDRDEWIKFVEKSDYPVQVIDTSLEMLGGAWSELVSTDVLTVPPEKREDIARVRKLLKGKSSAARSCVPKTPNRMKFQFYTLLAKVYSLVSPNIARDYRKRAARRRHPGQTGRVEGDLLTDSNKPSLLVVAGLDGCSWTMDLVWVLSRDFNVSILFIDEGVPPKCFSQICTEFFVRIPLKKVLTQSKSHRHFTFAIVTSRNAGFMIQSLHNAKVPPVWLLNSVGSTESDVQSIATMAFPSGAIVVPTKIVENRIKNAATLDSAEKIHFAVPGRWTQLDNRLEPDNLSFSSSSQEGSLAHCDDSRFAVIVVAGEDCSALKSLAAVICQIDSRSNSKPINFILLSDSDRSSLENLAASPYCNMPLSVDIAQRVRISPSSAPLCSTTLGRGVLVILKPSEIIHNRLIEAAHAGLPVLCTSDVYKYSDKLEYLPFPPGFVTYCPNSASMAAGILRFAEQPQWHGDIAEMFRTWASVHNTMDNYAITLAHLQKGGTKNNAL